MKILMLELGWVVGVCVGGYEGVKGAKKSGLLGALTATPRPLQQHPSTSGELIIKGLMIVDSYRSVLNLIPVKSEGGG